MSIRCFWLEPVSGKYQHELRRYRSSEQGNQCPLPHGYHNASVILGVVERPDIDRAKALRRDAPTEEVRRDPRWPRQCGCGYVFLDEENWQENFNSLFQRSDTGELVTIKDAPIGAMWDAHWMPDAWAGPDGRKLIVKIPQNPDGSGESHWHVDGKCSNCTRPGEKHYCWVRHGEPPNIHVDKSGDTCAAGAGSIVAHGGWHGFLHNGCLVSC